MLKSVPKEKKRKVVDHIIFSPRVRCSLTARKLLSTPRSLSAGKSEANHAAKNRYQLLLRGSYHLERPA